MSHCELCNDQKEDVVVRTKKLRVILVDDANYPGFCRVIWNAHVKEMTDLPVHDRSSLMQAVCKVEQAMRDVMQPQKINLASLGNVTPHLHWHVIPRYQDDAHFPNPIWAASEKSSQGIEGKRSLIPQLREALLYQFSE